MLPLAVYLKKAGHNVLGSDRSFDQGKTPNKAEKLKSIGIEIMPQNGSMISGQVNHLVVSTAVEDSIPDVAAAKKNNIPIIKRGALLAEYFNKAKAKIAVAGTSGKSTVTGMIGTIFEICERDPTVLNGGEIINFEEEFSNVRAGGSGIFIAEMDESDKSIEHYFPSIAVLNNIALDHMSMKELHALFGDYLARATDHVVVNYGNKEVKELCDPRVHKDMVRYAIEKDGVEFAAWDLEPRANGISFNLRMDEEILPVNLGVPGRHNVENALAAIAAAHSYGLEVDQVIHGLEHFKGIHRRLEHIGEKNGITVIDDFGHNPDKIAASLQTLKEFDGRLIVMFQPHGFGPLRLMGTEMIESFTEHFDKDDILLMPEVYYAGGTVDRSVTARDIIDRARSKGLNAHWFSERQETQNFVQENAKSGDRVIIMGARDDTLHTFAKDLLATF